MNEQSSKHAYGPNKRNLECLKGHLIKRVICFPHKNDFGIK